MHRLGQEACISANDVKWNNLALVVLECNLESTADGGVEPSKAILAGLDFVVRPWLSVDMNDIPPKGRCFRLGIE